MKAILISSLVLVALIPSGHVRAGVPTVVINEVMANPLDEDRGEFVELYNWGDAPIDLSGWRLADAVDSNDAIQDYTGLDDWGIPGTVVPAGGYALIVDPEYAGQYAPFFQVHADSTKTVLLTIGLDTTVGNGLTNSGDVVVISDGRGFRAAFRWNSDAGQGVSWEKIEPQMGDGEDNWLPSAHAFGSTPGARNSVARAFYDVAVSGQDVKFSPPYPEPGQETEIRATLYNQGKSPATGIEVFFFHDLDGDTLLDEGELIGDPHNLSRAIPPDESVVLQQSWMPPSSGAHLLVVWASYPPDEDPSDNRAAARVQVPFAVGTLVINEIMYDPAPTGNDEEKEPEWVELLHLGMSPLDLAGWTIEDGRGEPRRICDSTVVLDPDYYAVIASGSEDDFRPAHPGVTGPVLYPVGGLPSLNNAQDVVVLRDPAATMVDSVLYCQDWGGGGGISLERINPHLDSNDPLNWSWCVHIEGATPGRKNSIFTPVVPAVSSLSANPNPFSPDGDGRQEVTIISYRLPTANGRISIRMYDICGKLVRTLVDQGRCGSAGEVIWDGRDDSGERLKMGIYVIFMEALDDRRGVVCRQKKTVVLAGRLH